MQSLRSCGDLIIAAVRAGVLPDVGGLHQLVAWHTADDSGDPRNVQARLVRDPANLFIDFVGGNLVSARLEKGRLVVVGPARGGLAPRIEPEILNLSETERYAVSCDLLADLIESCDGADVQQRSSTSQQVPEVFEDSMTVSWRGITCRFPTRRVLLFLLLKRILRRPGQLVSFDVLRSPNETWDNSKVEDSTIRGAVARLRKHLCEHKLDALAAAIVTGKDRNGGYVLFDPELSST